MLSTLNTKPWARLDNESARYCIGSCSVLSRDQKISRDYYWSNGIRQVPSPSTSDLRALKYSTSEVKAHRYSSWYVSPRRSDSVHLVKQMVSYDQIPWLIMKGTCSHIGYEEKVKFCATKSQHQSQKWWITLYLEPSSMAAPSCLSMLFYHSMRLNGNI